MLMKYKVSNQKLLCQFGFANTGKKELSNISFAEARKVFVAFALQNAMLFLFFQSPHIVSIATRNVLAITYFLEENPPFDYEASTSNCVVDGLGKEINSFEKLINNT